MQEKQAIHEHLKELRTRIILVIICFFISFIFSLFFSGSLYKLISNSFSYKLVVLGPDDILNIYIKLASLTSFTITLPFITYQIWDFIKPALKENEAKYLIAYIPMVFIFFALGLCFGFFFVTPNLLNVLLSLGEGMFKVSITADNYLSFVFHTTLPIAFLFELPVVVSFLTSISIITPDLLVKYRRYAYFILLVLAVIITPADMISDLMMCIPLIFIYELSVFISKVIYKRRLKDGDI